MRATRTGADRKRMPGVGGDSMPEQIWRLVFFFLLILLGYFVVRPALIPDSYGLYGRYRAAAVEELRHPEIRHVGNAACRECHDDKVETHAVGRHERVSCESCHRAGAAHVESWGEEPPFVPAAENIRQFCGVCHHERIARPTGFPQVDITEHMDGLSCVECHDPHSGGDL